MKKGERYWEPDGTLIEVRRVCAKQPLWADIRVTQTNGATWTKRQPLVNGAFTFDATKAGE